jgi:hypothetical protein
VIHHLGDPPGEPLSGRSSDKEDPHGLVSGVPPARLRGRWP